MRAWWRWVPVAAIAAGLLFSACGGGSSPAPAAISTAQDGVTPEELPTPAPATPATDDDDSARANATAQGACTQVPRELPLAERCAMAGAEVHTFPNTCVGKCRAMESEGMLCGQAMTPGCRCPEGQCIDDRTGCCRPLNK